MLLVVVWTMALLALLAARILSPGRGEVRTATLLRDAAVAEAAADAAIDIAVFRMLAAGDAPPPPTLELRRPGAVVAVTIADEAEKVPLNSAPVPLVAALLEELGATHQDAAHLAAALQAWRAGAGTTAEEAAKQAPYRAAGRAWGPPGEALHGLDELALLDGMAPALLARLLPHVTVFSEALPSTSSPDKVVAAAAARLAGEGIHLASPGGPRVLRITAVARGAAVAHGATVAAREAVVQFDQKAAGYRVLDRQLVPIP